MPPITDEVIAKLGKELCFRTDTPGKETFIGLCKVWRFYLDAKSDQRAYRDQQNMVFKAERLLREADAFGHLKAGINRNYLPPEILNFNKVQAAEPIRKHSPTLDDPGGDRPRLITGAFEQNRRRH